MSTATHPFPPKIRQGIAFHLSSSAMHYADKARAESDPVWIAEYEADAAGWQFDAAAHYAMARKSLGIVSADDRDLSALGGPAYCLPLCMRIAPSLEACTSMLQLADFLLDALLRKFPDASRDEAWRCLDSEVARAYLALRVRPAHCAIHSTTKESVALLVWVGAFERRFGEAWGA